jgi:hypothetical protein
VLIVRRERHKSVMSIVMNVHVFWEQPIHCLGARPEGKINLANLLKVAIFPALKLQRLLIRVA